MLALVAGSSEVLLLVEKQRFLSRPCHSWTLTIPTFRKELGGMTTWIRLIFIQRFRGTNFRVLVSFSPSHFCFSLRTLENRIMKNLN
jgi:hypothetical protein